MKQNYASVFLILSLLFVFIVALEAGGVYPNYHEHYDFVSYDKDKTAAHYDAEKKWWQTASFYQIYPRSFKDSDGDGIGDLKGITQQLSYLKEIGITATWLSPIFTSPMADFGYDIANFTEIDPMFGTMADFEALIAKAKVLNIKIILDFVPNHSSDESEWFKLSEAADPVYKDFYIWHPGKMIDGKRQPPTNWVSVFHGSAWEWSDKRQAYYLCQFYKKQPDLNYRNPKVMETMNDILRFWLRKGIAGFRVDAVPFIYEVPADSDGNWPDEPRKSWVLDPNDYMSLSHIYTFDQPENVGMVYEWRKVLNDFQKENGGDELVLLTEAYSSMDIMMKYYGNETAEGAHVPFNFLMLNWIKNDSDAYHYAETINTWLREMPEGRTPNWVIGNHDNGRVGSRLGTDRIDMLNMLIMTLPGVSVTYNGEEIGMTDFRISWKDTVDPKACNTNSSVFEKFTRDPERTPFQWSNAKNAGFSDGPKAWLPVADNYRTVNVKRERGIPLSHLNIFKRLQALRAEPTMRHGDVAVKAVVSNNVLGVKRSLLNEYTFVTLMNIADGVETVDLTRVFDLMPVEFVYHIVTDRSRANVGDLVKSQKVRLLPKEAVVLRSPTKLTTKTGYFAYYAPADAESKTKTNSSTKNF